MPEFFQIVGLPDGDVVEGEESFQALLTGLLTVVESVGVVSGGGEDAR